MNLETGNIVFGKFKKNINRLDFLMLAIGLLFLLWLISPISPFYARAATFTVDSVGNGGDANAGNGICDDGGGNCTLRAAIEEANASAGTDTISFNIAGAGPHTIDSTAAGFPAITEAVIIDGYTETDAVKNTNATGALNSTIQIAINFGDNIALFDGFTIQNGGSNSIIRGLNIHSCTQTCILLDNADNVRIEGNFIGTNTAGSAGTDIDGTVILANNGSDGVVVGTNGDGVDDNSERNLFAHTDVNAVHVLMNSGINTTIAGNLFGMDKAGTTEISGGAAAIQVNTGSVVGTDGDGTSDDVERNVISGSVQMGVVINNNASNVVIAGNFIGTNAAGTAAMFNGGSGILASATNQDEIGTIRIGTNGDGTSDTLERNVISGNGDGVGGAAISLIKVNGTTIAGNFIGTNAAGTAVVGNKLGAISALNVKTLVIGTNGDNTGDASEGNLISGNNTTGSTIGGVISLLGSVTTGSVIAGNIMGLNAAGTGALGNGGTTPPFEAGAGTGIYVANDVTNLTIGTDGDGTSDTLEDNTISSGACLDGAVYIEKGSGVSNMTGIVIAGNKIGTDINGSGNFGYTVAGLAGDFADCSGIVINGNNITDVRIGSNNNDVNEANIIANNAGDGIKIVNDATGVTISRNSIHSNTSIGIDLNDNGVTNNDAGDTDTGANNLVNFPLITTNTTSTIAGSLDLDTAENLASVEIFVSDDDASGNGEGQTFLGAVTPAVGGAWTFGGVFTPGNKVTAVATDTNGNTSEFSVNATIAGATTFTVDDTGDAGDANAGNGTCATAGAVCTLRAAIEEANALAGAEVINFNIAGGGPHTISPASNFAALSTTDGITINGCSETGSVANTGTTNLNTTLQIIVDGAGARTNIFNITGDNHVISCMNLRDTTGDIIAITGDSNKIQGNYIGTNTDGSTDDGSSGGDGVEISGAATGNIIGTDGDDTADLEERNLISGNNGNATTAGVRVTGAGTDSNTVAGNIIGLNAAGNAAIANSFGIFLSEGDTNIIGTDGDGTGDDKEKNIVSGNSQQGLSIDGIVANRAVGNVIAGNIVGLDATGTNAVANSREGLTSEETTNTRIGTNGDNTSDTLERNLFSGNTLAGVYLELGTGMVFAGNYVGWAADGTTARGNGGHGVNLIDSLSGAVIGANGDASAGEANEPNKIGNNNGDGVRVVDSTNTTIRISSNQFAANTGDGIDLNANGVSANDVGDADNGANNLLNFPVITSASTTQVVGTLDIDTAKNLARVEVYNADSAAGQNGEGSTFLGAVTPDAAGDWTFNGAISLGTVTVLTIDTNGNTSEFGTNFTVVVPPLVVDDTGDAVDANAGDGNCATAGAVCTLRAAIEEANALAGANTINFSIAGGGPHTISPGSDLPALSGAGGVTIDGCTEPGASANTSSTGLDTVLQIIIDGGGARTNIFNITSASNTIHCLNMRNTANDIIKISGGGATANKITGSFIGTNVAGTAASNSTSGSGVLIEANAGSNIIGTDGDNTNDLAERNLINGGTAAGQEAGVQIDAANSNRVAGNLIGTNASGTAAIGNRFGVNIANGGDFNAIGVNYDASAGEANEGNVISGNIEQGIKIFGTGGDKASVNFVGGNIIGLDASGNNAVPNVREGIGLDHVTLSIIGTDGNNVNDTIERNIISGNTLSGFFVSNTASTSIAGNFIGTDITGLLDRGNNPGAGNDNSGIHFFVSNTGVIVGADGNASAGEANEGNTIAFNGRGGVFVRDTSNTLRISRNSFFSNNGIAIDLGQGSNDDVTLNDVGDADTGGNNLVNFPVITAASDTTISGTLDIDTAPANARVEVYVSDEDASGNGEGRTFLGAATPDAQGAWSLAGSFTGNTKVTALTIDTNENTSEFSSNFTVVAASTGGGGGGGTSNPVAGITTPPGLTGTSLTTDTRIGWEVKYLFNNEQGLNLKDNVGNTLLAIQRGQRIFIENNLKPNTRYERMATTFSSQGESQPSSILEGSTLMTTPTDLEILGGADKTKLSIKVKGVSQFTSGGNLPSAATDKTAYYFENLTNFTNSGWVQSIDHEFDNLFVGIDYEFRVKARNHEGKETGFSRILKYSVANDFVVFTPPATPTVPQDPVLPPVIETPIDIPSDPTVPTTPTGPPENPTVPVDPSTEPTLPKDPVAPTVNCPDIESYVCGNDGETYLNTCYAIQAGTSILYAGSCRQTQPEVLPKEQPGEYYYEEFFGADLESPSDEISISGYIENEQTGITLRGTTEPNVFVTIYINDYVAFKTISDENGEWVIEVLNEDIIAEFDQEQRYVVEVSAKRVQPVGGVVPEESKRVRIGKLDAILPEDGELQVELDEGLKKLHVTSEDIASLEGFLGERVSKSVQIARVAYDDSVEWVDENEETVRGTVAVSLPVVLVVNPTIVAHFPHIPLVVYHFFSWLLGVLGIKKKRNPWGEVYNSITKEGVPLAIVRLFELNKDKTKPPHLIETQVTDKQGRFGFLPKPGYYYIEVVKPGFSYPSRIVKSGVGSDVGHDHVYHREQISITEGKVDLSIDIPIDSLKPSALDTKLRLLNLWVQLKKGVTYISFPVLLIGMAFSLVITLVNPVTINIVLLTVYLLFTYFHLRLTPPRVKPWGVVFDAITLEPIPLAMISVIDNKFNKVLKTRLTDYEGRFNFLPPEGNYKLTVSKEDIEFPVKEKKKVYTNKNKKYKHPYYGEEFKINKENEVVNLDIPVVLAKNNSEKSS